MSTLLNNTIIDHFGSHISSGGLVHGPLSMIYQLKLLVSKKEKFYIHINLLLQVLIRVCDKQFNRQLLNPANTT